MESPGKFLKRERETRSISLEQISTFTKIKEHHLKAIEEDRYDALPHTLYVKGFLTGYARYLALNPKEIVHQYEAYLSSLLPPDPVEAAPPEAHPRKKVKHWLLISLVFAIILCTAFYMFYPARPPEEKKSANSPSLISPNPAVQAEDQTPHPGNTGAQLTGQATSTLTILEAGMGTPGSKRVEPGAPAFQ